MKIRYEQTVEDLVAFNRYHFDHSPAIRRQQARARWGWAALFAGGGAAMTAWDGGNLFWLIVGGFTAVLILVLLPRMVRRDVNKLVRRAIAEGANKGLLGPRELELAGDDLIERSEVGENRVRVDTLERVVSDGRHTFIYVNPVAAAVIPHDQVPEADRLAFVGAVTVRLPPADRG